MSWIRTAAVTAVAVLAAAAPASCGKSSSSAACEATPQTHVGAEPPFEHRFEVIVVVTVNACPTPINVSMWADVTVATGEHGENVNIPGTRYPSSWGGTTPQHSFIKYDAHLNPTTFHATALLTGDALRGVGDRARVQLSCHMYKDGKLLGPGDGITGSTVSTGTRHGLNAGAPAALQVNCMFIDHPVM